MYSSTLHIPQHRSLQPSGAVPPGPSGGPPPPGPPGAPPSSSISASSVRFMELLDIAKQEFDQVSSECLSLKQQRDEYESRVGGQVNELGIIRQALYELEAQHGKIRQQYEAELQALRAELSAVQQHHPPPPPLHPNQGPPSQLGLSSVPPPPNTHSSHGPPPHAYPPQQSSTASSDPYYPPSSKANPPPSYRGGHPDDYPPPHLAPGKRTPHLVPPAPPSAAAPIHGPAPPPGFIRDRYPEDVKTDIAERDRERERVDRERAERERERERQERERRERADRERSERDRAAAAPAPPPAASSTSTGAALPPAPSTAAPVPVAPTPTPTEQTPAAAPTSPTTAVPAPTANGPAAANGTTSTAVTTTAGSSSQLTMAALTDLDPEQVPPELKKEGSDWFAIFNPQAQRKLDISLTLSLTHESVVCCVRFSADGKFLATGCNRTAQIYDTKTGAKTCTLSDETVTKNGDLYIRSVCFSPDGKLLATGAEDKQIRIWDIASRTIRQVFSGHQQEIYSLDFSRDGRVIVSGSGDKTARVWNMETGAHQTLSILEPDNVDAGVTSVAISPDGQLVAAGSLDTIVRIWDVTTGHLIERLRGHLDSVYSVAFTPDGKGLVSGSLDKTLKYWDLSPLLRSPNRTVGLSQGGSVPSGQQPVTNEGGEKGSTCSVAFSGHKDYVLSVAVSPDGAWVVSGSKDRGVQFWDPRTGLTQLMLQGHKNSVISIDLSPVASPSGGLLASGSGDWIARVCTCTRLFDSLFSTNVVLQGATHLSHNSTAYSVHIAPDR
ncbi:hypothetical protein M407DRAFT_75012 [Tulasnella calospora MUT 4182]|uniref:Transcriptional repressor Tup1 N-terminal domain-containing protein n=1 Tax=Tulasnella calospora MUT 4182 TaxID=1051891 RepID=A0A0C3QJ08_9AGAM|nr:hypothetical protein M407DRAFT_75012 [Tulasnella calospora MUT 4182]